MARLAGAGGADSIWLSDHFFHRPQSGGTTGYHEAWTLLSALACGHGAGRDRDAGPRDELPLTGAAREDGRDGRRRGRRAADPRAGLRLARARVPGVRHPVRSSSRPVRGGARDHRPASARGLPHVQRSLVFARRRDRPARACPPDADHGRRRPAPDDACDSPVCRPVADGLVRRPDANYRTELDVPGGATPRAAIPQPSS